MSDETQGTQGQEPFNVGAHPEQTAALPDAEKPGEQDDAHHQQNLEAGVAADTPRVHVERQQDLQAHQDGEPRNENVLEPDSPLSSGSGEQAGSFDGPGAGHENDSEAAQEIARQDAEFEHVSPMPGDGNPGVEHNALDYPPVQPVVVDGRNRRSDDDAIVHSFVDIVDGEHKGRFGAFERVLKHDPKTGYPSQVLVRTRDALNESLAVPYEHVRTSLSHGGR